MIDLPPYSLKSESKIVYLDQKCWINLAKIYYGNPTYSRKKILDKIMNASDNGSVIFPISMIHVSETTRIKKTEWRNQLAFLMANVSKGYAITPYWPKIEELEIENLILEKLNLPTINVVSYWLGKGFTHLLGKIPKIVSDTIDPEVLDILNKDILELLKQPDTLKSILEKHDDSSKQIRKKAAQEFEDIRIGLLSFKDNDFRRRVFLGRNTIKTIVPKILDILIKYKIPQEFINVIIPENDIENNFLNKLPTKLCEFNLLFQRYQELQRPINENDIADIWHLTLAIPYSNIVIADKMMVSLAKKAKLDVKCNTIILRSISELVEYL